MNRKPDKPKEHIDPERLIEASEAVVKAIEEVHAATGRHVDPVGLMGTMLQPKCLCDFTRFEVEEATAFLERLGVITR